MKRLMELSVAFGLLFLISACGHKDEVALLEGGRGDGYTGEDLSRLNLIRIYSKGALEEYFTSIDFGVERYYPYASGKHECRILEPKSDALRARAESPAHMYMNRTDAEVKNNEGTVAADEVFYKGDANNRNGRGDPYTKTQLLTEERLQFKRVWQLSQNEYRFFVFFSKGGANFSGNVQVKTWVKGDGCETGAYMCTDVDSAGRCKTENFPIRFKSIVVSIQPLFYPWGNYITKIEALPYDGTAAVTLYPK